MKIFMITLLITFANLFLYTGTIINPKKIAKIGNKIILKSEVEKLSKSNNITFEKAKNIILEDAILYIGARMYSEEPIEEMVEKSIKKEKINYARKVGKILRDITDEEFLSYLHYNNISMKTYKEEVKKNLWRKKFINEKIKQEKQDTYTPSSKEIKKLIKDKPELFEEKAGILLSMIYFSYFADNGKYKPQEEIIKLYKKSKKCLTELINGKNFENMVKKYSDDLISLNNTPNGRIGFVAIDDPKTSSKFSNEIKNEFIKAKIGIIIKIFQTKNGLYIFSIEKKYKPIKISNEAAKLKSATILKEKHKKKTKENFRKKLIKALKPSIDVIIY